MKMSTSEVIQLWLGWTSPVEVRAGVTDPTGLGLATMPETYSLSMQCIWYESSMTTLQYPDTCPLTTRYVS
jgi:hypothetical protein